MSAIVATVLRRSVPAHPLASRLLPTMAMQSLGFGMLTTLSTLYYAHVLGFSAAQIGAALTIASLLGLLAGVPFGHLSDRVGARGLLMGLLALEGLSVLGFLAVGSWTGLLVALSAYQIVDRAGNAVRGAFIAKSVSGPEQTVVRAFLRAVANIGFGVGALLVGAALLMDSPWAYRAVLVLACAGYLGAALSLLRCAPTEPVARARRLAPWAAMADRRYLGFAMLNVPLTFHYAILEIGLPLWIVQHSRAPAVLVTAMFLVNTVSVTALQVLVSRAATTLAHARRAMLWAGGALAAACALIGISGQCGAVAATVVLLVAGLLHALGEMFQTAASTTVAYELAPEHGHGQYQGLFSTSLSGGLMLGAWTVSTPVLGHGLPGWLGLGTLFAVCSVATAALCAVRPAVKAVHC